MGYKPRTSKIANILSQIQRALPAADKAYGNRSTEPSPGATEGELREAETRLGRALPEDYREFLLWCNGWSEMCQFEWLALRKLLDEKWQRLVSDEFEGPGIANGIWIGRSLNDDLGFYLRRTKASWEVLWVSVGMFGKPVSFSSVIDRILADFYDQTM